MYAINTLFYSETKPKVIKVTAGAVFFQVTGDKDADGFYHGESGGLSGYVPSNMVAEIPVDDEYLKHLLMQQGFLPVDHTGISLFTVTRWQNSVAGVTEVQLKNNYCGIIWNEAVQR